MLSDELNVLLRTKPDMDICRATSIELLFFLSFECIVAKNQLYDTEALFMVQSNLIN